MTQVIGGIIEVQVNGKSIDIAVGDIEMNFGEPIAKEVLGGHGRMVGVVLEPQAPMISGELHVTDLRNYRELLRNRDATVTGKVPQGTFVLRNAVFSSEGGFKSSEMKAAFKFVGRSADFV
jgi:hypothetical protein